MSIEGVAYRSGHPQILKDWDAYNDYVETIRQGRNMLSERYARSLMVARMGFGHGTRVVGFARQATDDRAIEPELRLDRRGILVPKLTTKAGKTLATELGVLTQDGPNLTGMPEFQLVGLRSLAPALMLHDGTVWARWSDPIPEDAVDTSFWEQMPLSAYFAAVEANEAAKAVDVGA